MSAPNDIELAQVKALCAKFAAASDGYEYAVGLTALEFYVATVLHMTEVSVDEFMAGVRRTVERMRRKEAAGV